MTTNIFRGEELRIYLQKNDSKIEEYIHNEEENYLLNVNKKVYIDHIYDEFSIEVPLIDFENYSIEYCTKEIYNGVQPYTMLPQGRSVEVIVYNIPFKGNENLLKYQPSTFLSFIPELYVNDGHICFDVYESRLDRIKAEEEHSINNLKEHYGYFKNQIEEYNNNLEREIEHIFDKQKKKILDKNQLLESINVPIKKNQNIPETYIIKPKTRKSIRKKPKVKEKEFTPEPTLDNETYSDILQTIHDFGKVLERNPSTYKNKSEEDLRDHLLFVLEPQFGETTGETFNKSGKTDILIRYEKSNIFIAELKFWTGEKSYLDAISQLIKYLTWRDSKVAVVILVKNKQISKVLNKIDEVTQNHPNFLAYVNNNDESWFNYNFHINDDENRVIELAVLVFHLPQ